MNEKEHDSMKDGEWDSLLESGLSEPPPEHIVRGVTPCKRALMRIFVGMTLCLFTLNFLYLNVILPFVGMVLTLLGFRALRRENRWFFAGYLLSLARMILQIAMTAWEATIASCNMNNRVKTALIVFVALLVILILLSLSMGLAAVRRKAELPTRMRGTVGLLIWYIVLCILGAIRYQGVLMMIAVVVSYIFLIRSLVRLSRELDEAGYAVRPSAVQLSDHGMAILLCSLLVLGLTAAFLWGGTYPMRWEVRETFESPEAARVRDELLSLGFPSDVLEDLSKEDILACKGALRVVVREADVSLSDRRTVRTTDQNGVVSEFALEAKEMHITGVGVELSAEAAQWKLFHHFRYSDDTKFCGTECIELWTADGDPYGWTVVGDFSGRLLCDMDGRRMTSPYYAMQGDTYTRDVSMGAWRSTYRGLFADFSMPQRAKARSGYISYAVKESGSSLVINSWFNYTHQTTALQYPATTANGIRKEGFFNRHGAFLTIQDALQIWME